MLKVLNLNLDLDGIGSESIVSLIAIQGNKIYKKKVMDPYYKLWKKFKNATRAKKFMEITKKEKGISLLERSKNIYISSRLI